MIAGRVIVKSVFEDRHAAARSGFDGLMPLMKSTPSMTSARWAKPRSLRQGCLCAFGEFEHHVQHAVTGQAEVVAEIWTIC
jgi:hypothetical protein